MSLTSVEEMKPSPPQLKKEDEERSVKREEVVDDDAKEFEDWNESRGRSGTAEKGKAAAVVLDEEEVKSQGVKPEAAAIPANRLLDDIPFLTPVPTPVGESSSASLPFASTSAAIFPFGRPVSPSRAPLAPTRLPAPTSPSRHAQRIPLPLDHLISAGTILLKDHQLVSDDLDVAQDGWLAFMRDSVQPASQAAVPADEDPFTQPPSARAKSPSKARAGQKRRASTSAGQPPRKKAKVGGNAVLDSLASMSAALACSCTMHVSGTDVVLRVYLVPQDLPELREPAYSRGKTKRPAGATVLSVLQAVRISEEEWMGVPQDGDVPTLMEEEDRRSLLEVYRDIESPAHDESFLDQVDAAEDVKSRLAWSLTENPPGITTTLFPYQRATLAKMLTRELAPQDIPHPAFIARSTSLSGRQRDFWVSIDGSVRLKPTVIREPQGGILAEDMGVGKTLIVLSLVMSTLSELPSVDGFSSYLDNSQPSPSPVLLTALSERFPFKAEIEEQKKLKPRLVQLLPGVELDVREQLDYEAALAAQEAEDARIPDLPFPSLRSLAAHIVKTSTHPNRYPHFDEVEEQQPLPESLFSLLQDSPPYYRLYPSLAQENSREGRRGNLRPQQIFVAATTLVVVPTDLVRQWHEQIKEHVAPKALRYIVLRTAKDKFPTAAEMAQQDLILMSVKRFSDAADAEETALRHVHWKRLVIDEGHVLANGTRMRKLAEELRCESRWAVSGTPSTNLRVVQEEEEVALFTSPSAAGGDRTDIDRLGQLFARFIQHDAFPKHDSLRKLCQTHVYGGGERAARLAAVFDRSVIRHHPKYIKDSFELPKLSKRTVHIPLEEAERRVYNVLVAFFASNAITSQRVDVDYLFHPSKRAHLEQLMDNLSTSTTFFGSYEFVAMVHDARNFAKKMLDGPKSDAWTEEERVMERKVLEVFQEALDDPETILTAGTPSVAFEVTGLDDELVATFRGLKAVKNPRGRTLVPLPELVRMRVDLDELRRVDVKAWEDDEELVEELITFEEKRKRLDAAPKPKKKEKDQPPANPEDEEPPLFKKRSKNDQTPLAPFPDDSIFRNIGLVRTTSSKINYIIREMREHPDDKFIIFSSSNVDIIFANLSEALDILGIRHLVFAGSHARSGDRGEKAQRFNSTTARECQAILVDAKLGGRGFGLTAACRIIAVEPIWKPDLEVQAEKRAHRLGQTKPVDMKILVVANSFEDAMLSRRAQVAPADFGKKVKAPQQDDQLRSLLQRAQYLEPDEKARDGGIVSAALDPPIIFGSSSFQSD
ncbi:Proteophosphoglycan ppg4 [Rhodotorula toruloides ATCC 204091]|uniref:Proteophosphoglycan ppg4 n=1 Tax=Rhodotorula toruloides TaxID=5286 RepID=A0A0K3CBG7_RHOTO|nr:Proteophosphoglycan ppg4 [Rhodotorula toruloides ATCC 204091]PRQ76057.1 Proteophosphoglycan ppg4 [Rhodotorula toruloides]